MGDNKSWKNYVTLKLQRLLTLQMKSMKKVIAIMMNFSLEKKNQNRIHKNLIKIESNFHGFSNKGS